MTDPVGELLAEFARPLPHGFVADDDAAGSEQLLHHAETKREAEIKPYGMADDLATGGGSHTAAIEPLNLFTTSGPQTQRGRRRDGAIPSVF